MRGSPEAMPLPRTRQTHVYPQLPTFELIIGGYATIVMVPLSRLGADRLRRLLLK